MRMEGEKNPYNGIGTVLVGLTATHYFRGDCCIVGGSKTQVGVEVNISQHVLWRAGWGEIRIFPLVNGCLPVTCAKRSARCVVVS